MGHRARRIAAPVRAAGIAVLLRAGLLGAVLLGAGLLAGCGQRGPLTLPARDVENTSVPAPEPPVEEDEQESDDEGS